MKVAIMQPYFLPYIGYFQLIEAVDLFVIYDDVNYIKKGWINRNNLLVNSKEHLFSIALKEASQNKLINEITIDATSAWKINLLKTIELSYKKAPFFEVVFPIVQKIIQNREENLSKYLLYSLRQICDYLQITTKFAVSSALEKDNSLKAQYKIIEICKYTNATQYINAIGGIELYDKSAFSKENIELKFIQPLPIFYSQFKNEFIPWLSIIDVMMFNSVTEIRNLLNQKIFI